MPDHLHNKFDKKVIRCIFVGYDSERKDGDVAATPQLDNATHREMWCPIKHQLGGPRGGYAAKLDLEVELQEKLEEPRKEEEPPQ